MCFALLPLFWLLLWCHCPELLQVTNAQVGKLARLAAGRPVDSTSSNNGNGNGTGAVASGPELVMDDFRHTADAAYAAVDVPDSVVDILAELRCYLQVQRGGDWTPGGVTMQAATTSVG